VNRLSFWIPFKISTSVSHLFEKSYITNFLADSVDNPKYLDGKKILKAIAAQQGILVQRAEDVYSFSHLTLQEYLTAHYISQKDDRIKQLVTKHLTNRRWREIFLLVAGLKDDAGELLKLMEKGIQELVNTDKLHNLLVWTKDITNHSAGDFQPVGKRAIVLANANANSFANANAFAKAYALSLANALACANAFTNAYALALACANALGLPNTNALANALKYFIDYAKWSEEWQIYQDVDYGQLIGILSELQQQIPDDDQAIEVRHAFSQKMIQIWLEAFQLNPEMVNLSKSELKALDNYFYANLLMVKCKNAAVKVSRRTWLEIESRMLMPFREPT
jgi:predicted NACHT family NTPase